MVHGKRWTDATKIDTMKVLQVLIAFLFFSFTISAQSIEGDWHGALDIQGIKLRLVFHITKDGDALKATMDSPDQGATGIPVHEIAFEENQLSVRMPNLGLTYSGIANNDFTEIKGDFQQATIKMPLTLNREQEEAQTFNRPQEPEKPYPYYEEEVTFKNEGAGIELAGTLTLPSKDGQYPVVILITGSGPQNRDEELLGHKPFLIISDYLTRQGIGVLRYDDRGVGSSTGDFASANSADFATDVLSAIDYLKKRKEIRPDQIGLVGHSEGGLIAPMVAAKSTDVAYSVLLAGPGVPSTELMKKQLELISRASGESEEDIAKSLKIMDKAYGMVKDSKDPEKLKADLKAYFETVYNSLTYEEKEETGDKETFINQTTETITSPWFIYFLKFDPTPYLRKTSCPVLAINGEKDLQVEPKQNLGGIERALKDGGNDNFVVREFPGMNHLFQTCETGAPAEYASLEETFSEEALQVISEWILKTVQ